MNAAELIGQLKFMSHLDRLLVIETAARLIREDFTAGVAELDSADSILRVAGCLSGDSFSATEIERELYGKTEGDSPVI